MSRHPKDERRRHARKPVRHAARILVRRAGLHGRLEEHGVWHECIIEDISPGGAKVSLVAALTHGDEVHLEIGRFGTFPALVAWAASGEFGLRFTGDPAKLGEVVVGLAVYG